MRPLFLLAPLLLLSGACATTPAAPPMPSTRTVAASPEVVRERVAAAARDLGLSRTDTPAGVRAVARGAADQDWARCGRALITSADDDAPRSSWISPDAREASVTVSTAPTAGGRTDVTVSTRFAATYRDPYRNLPVTRLCPSTGVLESRLLDAAAGTAG